MANIFNRAISEVEALTTIKEHGSVYVEALAEIYLSGQGSISIEALAAIYERNTKTVEATTYIATPSTDAQYSEAHEVNIQKTGSHEVNIIKQEGIIVRRY